MLPEEWDALLALMRSEEWAALLDRYSGVKDLVITSEHILEAVAVFPRDDIASSQRFNGHSDAAEPMPGRYSLPSLQSITINSTELKSHQP